MAGGASSRMKRSLEHSDLDERIKQIAYTQHKSLIPLGNKGNPLLYYLLRNAKKAGYTDCYIITNAKNQGFKDLVGNRDSNNDYEGLKVHFAIQYIPKGREKPLGTADALQQCMQQYPKLKEERFTVCNGDNLYSVGALTDLREEREASHAIISYSGSGLGFSDERLAVFAVLDISSDGFLKTIIEKPGLERMEAYRDKAGELRISMNIFNFTGEEVFPYLENCPINPERDEKELPEGVRNIAQDDPTSTICFPRSEQIPDLTSADDIKRFKLAE